MKILTFLGFSISLLFFACGTSIFKPVSSNNSKEAIKEDALIALDNKDFSEASSKLAKLWADEKTNETAQLYSIATLGTAGIDLFNIVRNAITITSGTSNEKSSTGNSVMDNLSNVIPVITDESKMNIIKSSITILGEAPNQKDNGLFFQKCITGGIYALPKLKLLEDTIKSTQDFLQTLPTKVGASGNQCSASSTTINALGNEMTNLISTAESLAKSMQEIISLVGDCLGDQSANAQNSTNQIQSQISTLIKGSDKGCNLDSTLKIGGFTLPNCISSFLTDASKEAVANDGKIAGCELFINCIDGTCF